ncbi:hypothetical protein GCM10027299_11080 [Larkinella ripae]
MPVGIILTGDDSLWLPVLGTLVAGIFIWLIFRFNLRKREHLRLNHEIEARILQQQKLISELEFHNNQLKLSKEKLDLSISEKDRFISLLTHDLRSPLRFLYKNTAYLFRNWKQDSHSELDQLITEINNSTRQIHFLTEEMMLWIATQDNTYHIRLKEYTLLEIMQELDAFCKESILQQDNTLELEIPSRLTLHTDKILLKTILRNLLDNANKNTEEGVIRIQARQAYEHVVITVSDSGVGVSPALLQRINQFFSSPEPVQQLHTQFGHEIIRDFARLLNVSVVYEAPESGGLRVLLTIPN